MRLFSLAALALCAFSTAVTADDFAPAAGLRRPVAIALSSDESLVLVANRDAGSVSTLDARSLKVTAETPVGRRLSDIARIDATHFLVTDEAAHELVLLKLDGKNLAVAARLGVSKFPFQVTVTTDGTRAYVASLWSRRVSAIDLRLSEGEPLRIAAVVDLPIAPDKLLLVKNDTMLIAADHFAGRLGVLSLDGEKPQLTAVRTFFAENIRGLGLDPKSGLLAVAHTMLNEYAHTISNDIHWGVLMSNDLRWLRLDEVLSPTGDFYNKGHMHPLGEPGMGGSDPGELAFFNDGTAIVALSGVNKIAFGKEGDFGLHRYDVGQCPTAVAASNVHRRAFVTNTMSDSVSVIDMEKKAVIGEVSLGPTRELTLAERGEALFRSGEFSHDGWMTCQTCHTDGHTTGALNDNFSDKSFGAPKRVLSLLGVKETAPYAWNGKTESLDEQIRRSVEVTMQGPKPSDEQVAALAAYLHTLESPNSVEKLRGTEAAETISRGQLLFEKLECATCHAGPNYTTPDTYDVGLHDKEGNTHFNPPSLRGVGQRDPLFHDGSAATLEEVFAKHSHQLDGRKLSDDELRELVTFLRSL